mmetsp:Transcript_6521/g.10133  ORF Transcript_6521/g.10133 Transcript_6521/m.10133 type:complete len:679 (-) Transcript_6521:32-2068(-)|eukprot:CAMPEP_0175088376 /NCGR_PEP_ID=MMETSP0086_2-20121207/219_1 /TAXON_ID=136419 /ORGANISM="Unknown Unknown, Strain D1" /LENGTH=678 /DNA_ID=CAMNT_0016360813 /DNA_START=206 /DNA_END=2242 /DNA_ORIENTATION=+
MNSYSNNGFSGGPNNPYSQPNPYSNPYANSHTNSFNPYSNHTFNNGNNNNNGNIHMMNYHDDGYDDPHQDRDDNFNLSELKTEPDPLMPSINLMTLLYDPPVEGCQLRPYVSIMTPEGKTTALGSTYQTSTKDENSARFVWQRGTKRLCSVHGCQQQGIMQCLCCLRSRVPEEMSYFCSNNCIKMAWPIHKKLHSTSTSKHHNPDPWVEEEQEDVDDTIPASAKHYGGKLTVSNTGLQQEEYPERISCKWPTLARDTWEKVGTQRSYTPTTDDVGRALRLQCAPVYTNSKGQEALGRWHRLDTTGVSAAPTPPPPRPTTFKHHNQAVAGQQFKVACYNVLAQRYATAQMYPYCKVWALSWAFRSQNILRELLSHQGHIICLQEVQANHFDKFFQPNLSKVGYDGVFKAKTRGDTSFNGTYKRGAYGEPAFGGKRGGGGSEPESTMDGCAIFYKRDRFALVECMHIEFNALARQQFNDPQILRRVMKGNIALTVVLEELSNNRSNEMRRTRKRRICVANTHIYWDPEFADVKLWQTQALTQELERLTLQRQLPLLLCGDFNSMPDSSVYSFLRGERIPSDCPAYLNDICRILPRPESMSHRLNLTSAYASSGEPKYTNYTGHFVGTLDYILHSKNSLVVNSTLDVDNEELVSAHTALPSPLYPSDHICLVSEIDWLLDA